VLSLVTFFAQAKKVTRAKARNAFDFVPETQNMKYLHAMLRVHDLEKTSRFFTEGLGLKQTRRMDSEAGKFSLVYFAAPENPEAEIELTLNWGSGEDYGSARNFGHLAFEVDDIYAMCMHLQSLGVTINRPPRDGHMAFVRTPDLISIELLQKGAALPPQEPWVSMPNSGQW
jgi:lactoylglutathione lyase